MSGNPGWNNPPENKEEYNGIVTVGGFRAGQSDQNENIGRRAHANVSVHRDAGESRWCEPRSGGEPHDHCEQHDGIPRGGKKGVEEVEVLEEVET